MARLTDSSEQLLCSFCGKSQREVQKLVAGPGVYICDECVDVCNEIIVPGMGLTQPDEWAETHEYVVVLGWEKHPATGELYPKFEALGAEVLEERQAFVGGVVGRRSRWWRVTSASAPACVAPAEAPPPVNSSLVARRFGSDELVGHFGENLVQSASPRHVRSDDAAGATAHCLPGAGRDTRQHGCDLRPPRQASVTTDHASPRDSIGRASGVRRKVTAVSDCAQQQRARGP